MTNIILTQYSGKFIGPIAIVIGYVVDFLYNLMDTLFGFENIGFTIFLLTVVIYMLMLPLTYKQQKFSKLSAIMNPELQAVTNKYKGKTDQESRVQMQQETQAVYDKYGVSPTGSCLQLFIQMPIFFALYRVIANVPAYVGSVKTAYTGLVDKIVLVDGYQDSLTKIFSKMKVLNFDGSSTEIKNSIIDALYKLPTHSWGDLSGWTSLKEAFPDLTSNITATQHAAYHFNKFLGLDIANSPLSTIKSTFTSGHYFILFLAICVPILSGLTQYLNLKLSTASAPAIDKDNPMANSMNTMNFMMPLVSVFMVLTLPIGLGIYWISGALVRSIQQVVINKKLDKVDFDKVIAKNRKKAEAKRAKREGYINSQVAAGAKMNTRNISVEEKNQKISESDQIRRNAKPGSLASKANAVRDFNEKNNK